MASKVLLDWPKMSPVTRVFYSILDTKCIGIIHLLSTCGWKAGRGWICVRRRGGFLEKTGFELSFREWVRFWQKDKGKNDIPGWGKDLNKSPEVLEYLLCLLQLGTTDCVSFFITVGRGNKASFSVRKTHSTWGISKGENLMHKIGYMANGRAKKSNRGGETALSLSTAGSCYLQSGWRDKEWCYQSLGSGTILWEQQPEYTCLQTLGPWKTMSHGSWRYSQMMIWAEREGEIPWLLPSSCQDSCWPTQPEAEGQGSLGNVVSCDRAKGEGQGVDLRADRQIIPKAVRGAKKEGQGSSDYRLKGRGG